MHRSPHGASELPRTRFGRAALLVAVVLLAGSVFVEGSAPVASQGVREASLLPALPTGAGTGTPSLLGSSAPTSPPIEVCANASLLTGPSTPPAGAVTIPAGNDSDLTASYQLAADTTYWLAPGVHTLGTGPYSQFQPDEGDTFLGAPGAIVDGQNRNQFAFTDNSNSGSPNVTIEYLTIENFISGEGEGVVNQADQPGWVIEHNTIGPNAPNASHPGGAGVMLASDTVVEYNCLSENGEYGFSSFGGASNITLSYNEISWNDALGGYDRTGGSISCGCSGGGKFWISEDVSVTDNYVHDNGNVGLWVDTDDSGFLIAHNYIADNYAEGVIYEISYNGLIENNTFLRNAIGGGPGIAGFPDSALYISESGFDNRVANPFHARAFEVADNVFTDNWGGVVIWENPNRYCSDGSDSVCTLVAPSVFTLTSCAAHLAERSPVNYYDNCRWRAENVSVFQNIFSYDPTAVGTACTVANYCGYNGLFSAYGTAPYSGPAVPINITFDQNNHFASNTYVGPWNFEAWSQGNPDNPVNWTVWRANVTDACRTVGENSSGTCDSGFAQDQGSTWNAPAGPVVLSFDASPSIVHVGSTTLLNATTEGGVGALTYVYVGLPPGCDSANTPSLRCTPTQAGTFPITVFINDSAGNDARAATVLTVESADTSSGAGSDPWLYALAGVVAVAAVTAGMVGWRRRRSRPGGPT